MLTFGDGSRRPVRRGSVQWRLEVQTDCKPDARTRPNTPERAEVDYRSDPGSPDAAEDSLTCSLGLLIRRLRVRASPPEPHFSPRECHI